MGGRSAYAHPLVHLLPQPIVAAAQPTLFRKVGSAGKQWEVGENNQAPSGC